MATEERSAHEKRTLSNLEPDVGAVDEHELCECGHCDRPQEHRVPWPHIGGDVAHCDYHLARYRENNPDIWDRLRALDGVDDPDIYAVIGSRFLTLDEVPSEISVDGGGCAVSRSASTGGRCSTAPSPTRTERFALSPWIASSNRESVAIDRSPADKFVTWYRRYEGVHALDPDARDAVHGGGR